MAGFEKQGSAGVGIFSGWWGDGKSSDPSSVNHRWTGADVLRDRDAHMLSAEGQDVLARAAQRAGRPLTQGEISKLVEQIKAGNMLAELDLTVPSREPVPVPRKRTRFI